MLYLNYNQTFNDCFDQILKTLLKFSHKIPPSFKTFFLFIDRDYKFEIHSGQKKQGQKLSIKTKGKVSKYYHS